MPNSFIRVTAAALSAMGSFEENRVTAKKDPTNTPPNTRFQDSLRQSYCRNSRLLGMHAAHKVSKRRADSKGPVQQNQVKWDHQTNDGPSNIPRPRLTHPFYDCIHGGKGTACFLGCAGHPGHTTSMGRACVIAAPDMAAAGNHGIPPPRNERQAPTPESIGMRCQRMKALGVPRGLGLPHPPQPRPSVEGGQIRRQSQLRLFALKRDTYHGHVSMDPRDGPPAEAAGSVVVKSWLGHDAKLFLRCG